MRKNNHWKQSVLSMLCVFAVVLVHAQYNITTMLPSGALYQRSQLWNASVSNTGNAIVEVKIRLEMKDLQTHQTVLSAISSVFTLPRGVQAIQQRNLEPIQYNSSNAVFDRSPNALLPVGQYQVCYQLFIVLHTTQTLAADDCEQIEVEPLSPPLLTMPENDSVVTIATPNFTWAPPAPVSMFTNLNYDLLLSEVYEGQSTNDAIQKNIPLQQAQSLQQPFFTFPLQGPQLQKGKRYAWQIVAKDNQRFSARSEVWSFTIGNKKDTTEVNNTIYLLLGDGTSGIGTIDPGIIHIKYISSYAAHTAWFSFKDETGVIISTVKQQIKQGDNYFDIPLNGRFRSKHNYTATIADNGNTISLAFIIK